MRAKLLAAVLSLSTLALFCAVSAPVAHAQSNVAVLDMGVVFDAHPQFRDKVNALKAEVQSFDEQQKAERDSLVEMAKVLRSGDANSVDYRQRESELASRSANLEVQKRLKSKEFAQKEAAIYYAVYVDVSNKVQQYCNQNGIPMVVHFNSKQMNEKDPASILSRMNSNVIYHRPQANITQAIVQMCGGTAQTASYQQPDVFKK